MPTVNYANPKNDGTTRIFDSFYSYDVAVPSQEYDAVYSFMLSIFGTKEAAGNFTVTVFRISSLTTVPVMTLLQQLQGLGNMEITSTLAYYLNSQRSPSTLLGINSPVQPNYYVAHNIQP